jgi:integrase
MERPRAIAGRGVAGLPSVADLAVADLAVAETACRRGGALALRPDDLDPNQCLIRLREKGETVRWQPVSPTLMGRLVEHARERHARPDGQLLRYADGGPTTSRRYDHLWTRLGPAPALGPHPADQHPLDPPHDPDVGRKARSCIGCNIPRKA